MRLMQAMRRFWTRLPVPTRTITSVVASVALAALVLIGAAEQPSPALAADPAATRIAADDAWPAGFVRADGTHLEVDDRPYRFTGINIYNANNRGDCWYRMPGRVLEQSLDRLPAGETVIRAWFFQRIATRGGRRDWTAFDRTLAAARERRMRVIVTLADHWGACERSGIKPVSFYAGGYRGTVEPGNRTTYRRWVADVVRRYKDDPTILVWQLMNEAETQHRDGRCARNSVLRHFAGDMAQLVKSIDPYHLLSVGTIGTGQCGVRGDAYRQLHAVEGIDVCEYHDYGERSAIPALDPLTTRIKQCHAIDKPLFIGEMGVDGARSLGRRAARVIRQSESHFADGVVGVLMWNWRDRAHGGSSRRGFEIGPGDPALTVIGLERNVPDPHLIEWLADKRACAESPRHRRLNEVGPQRRCSS
jgi:mannan endo-1,4-beta-mannosidase